MSKLLGIVLTLMGVAVLWLALSAPGARVPALLVLGGGWVAGGIWVALDPGNRA